MTTHPLPPEVPLRLERAAIPDAAIPDAAIPDTDPIRRMALVVDLPAGVDPPPEQSLVTLADHLGSVVRWAIPQAATRVSLVPESSLRRPAPRPVPVARRLPEEEVLRVDAALREVRLGREPVRLAYKEFEVLIYLAANPRRVVSREELIDAIWDTGGEVPAPRTVDVHVKRIRLKLGRHQSVITTVRGSGYRFDPSPFVLFREGPSRWRATAEQPPPGGLGTVR